MQRLTTVLYPLVSISMCWCTSPLIHPPHPSSLPSPAPVLLLTHSSIPSSGSEGSLVNRTSQDSARAVSPGASAPPPIMDPQYPLAMASKSIYDDPRTTVFPSPSVPRSQSDIQHTYASVVTSASSSAVSSRRPSLVRRLTDEALSAATGKRTSSPGPSLLRLDRGLRVNLMQSGQGSKGKTRTGTPAPAYGGRLTSMAKGPAGRYVVGGGQCELENV